MSSERVGWCSLCGREFENVPKTLSLTEKYYCKSTCVPVIQSSRKFRKEKSNKPCFSVDELILMLGFGIKEE